MHDTDEKPLNCHGVAACCGCGPENCQKNTVLLLHEPTEDKFHLLCETAALRFLEANKDIQDIHVFFEMEYVGVRRSPRLQRLIVLRGMGLYVTGGGVKVG